MFWRQTVLFHGDKDERARIIAEELTPDGFDVCITSYEMVRVLPCTRMRVASFFYAPARPPSGS